jgi:hypothetical protein
VIATQVVADFVQVLSLDLLPDDAAVADQLPGCLEHHGPQSDAVFGVAADVALDPLFHSGAVHRRGIVAHGLGIGNHESQGVRIFVRKFAEHESLGFKNGGHERVGRTLLSAAFHWK